MLIFFILVALSLNRFRVFQRISFTSFYGFKSLDQKIMYTARPIQIKLLTEICQKKQWLDSNIAN